MYCEYGTAQEKSREKRRVVPDEEIRQPQWEAPLKILAFEVYDESEDDSPDSDMGIQTEHGPMDVFNCYVCHIVYLTSKGMKYHLRSTHRKKTLKVESENSDGTPKHDYDPGWIVEMAKKSATSDDETSWTCCLCKDFSTTFMAGIRAHIYQKHCNKLTKELRTALKSKKRKAEQKHVRDYEYIKKKIDESKAADGGDSWTCCICKNFTSSSPRGIRAHITQVHTTEGTKKSRLATRAAFRRARRIVRSEQPVRSHEWIMEKIDESKEADGSDSWTCCICKNFTTSFFSGIRFHIMYMHTAKVQKRQQQARPAKVDEFERHERDPEWVQEMVDKSAATDGDAGWSCCICKKFSSEFNSGIRTHIFQIHCTKERQKSEEPDEVEENERHEYDLEWIKEMVAKSSNTKSGWNCCICNNFTSKFPQGIRSHIAFIHCVKPPSVKVQPAVINKNDCEKHERDPAWIEEMIVKSKISDGWTCCLCGDFSSRFASGIKAHIYHRHTVKKDIKLEVESDEEEDEDDDGKVLEVEKHKRDPRWINQMIEKSREGDDQWNCFVCKNFTGETAIGIRVHITRVHCEPRSETIFPLVDGTSDDDVEKKQPDKQSDTVEGNIRNEWVQSIIDKSKVGVDDDARWLCFICGSSCASSTAIRNHITRNHRRELGNATRDKIRETYELLEAEERNEMVDKCCKKMMTLNGFREIWVCAECNSQVFYTRFDIHQHISMIHLKAKSGSSRKRGRSFMPDNDWLPSSKRARGDGGEAMEVQCDPLVTLTNNAMPHPFHDRQKFPDKETDEVEDDVDDDEDEDDGIPGRYLNVSEMNKQELRWLKRNIALSKNAAQKCWNCSVCKEILKHNWSMRYHLLAKHMQYYRLGKEKFKEHVEDCKTDEYRERQQRKKRGPKRRPKRPIKKVPPKSMRCAACSFQFDQQRCYWAHMKIHFLTDPVVVKMELHACNLCTMFFKSPNDLKVHNTFHLTCPTPMIMPAEGFRCISLLNPKYTSVEVHHEENNACKLSCGHCGKKFATDVEIKRHIMFQHQKALVCPLDNQSFSKLNEFLTHIHASHFEEGEKQNGGEKKYQCDHCGKRFNFTKTLLHHLKSELGIKDVLDVPADEMADFTIKEEKLAESVTIELP